jgi:type I restriction enzyme R subunit
VSGVEPQTLDQLQRLETELRERDEKLSVLLSGKATLDDELQRLRAEVAAARQAAAAQPDTHDYSETQTRDYFIDLLLKEAGWTLDQDRDREFEIAGMRASAPLSHQECSLSGADWSLSGVEGKGFIDYVLWGDDGIPLALVEAKRTRRYARVGQQQAMLYADCLEARFGRRPVIFYSNGYEHWLWDDFSHPPRPVQGFYKKALSSGVATASPWLPPRSTTSLSSGTTRTGLFVESARRSSGIANGRPFWSWLPVPARPVSSSPSATS